MIHAQPSWASATTTGYAGPADERPVPMFLKAITFAIDDPIAIPAWSDEVAGGRTRHRYQVPGLRA